MKSFVPSVETLEKRDCPTVLAIHPAATKPVTKPVAPPSVVAPVPTAADLFGTVTYTVPNLTDGQVTGLNLTNALQPIIYATCNPPADPWRMRVSQVQAWMDNWQYKTFEGHAFRNATVAMAIAEIPAMQTSYANWWNGPAVGWYGVQPVGKLPGPPTVQTSPDLLKYGNISEGALYNLELFEGAASASAVQKVGGVTYGLDVVGFLGAWLQPPPGVTAPAYGHPWYETLASAVSDFYSKQ